METDLCRAHTRKLGTQHLGQIDDGLMAVLYDKETNKYLGEVIIYTKFPEDFNSHQALKELIKRADTLEEMFDSFYDFAKEWNAVIQTRRNFSVK